MKRCNRCGCIAFDNDIRCHECGSSSFIGIRDDEPTLRDGIRYIASIDPGAPYDKNRCEALLSDIVPHLENEQHVLDTAFRVGAVESLRYARQGDRNYQIAIEQMERNGMLSSAGVAIVLEGYGFTPPRESAPPVPPTLPVTPVPSEPPVPPVPPAPPVNPKRNNRLAVGLLVAEVIVIAVLVAVLVPRVMQGTNKSTTTGQLSSPVEDEVLETETYSDEESDSEEEPDPEEESTENATPAEDPPAADPPEHRYEVVRADITWTDAKAACEAKGGHLATITSAEEFDTIVSLAKREGIEFVWLGGQTASGSTPNNGEWITGEPFTFSRWYEGEPSHQDVDGTPEQYIELWHVKATDEWSMNDERDRPLDVPASAQYMSGNMGYACEYEA